MNFRVFLWTIFHYSNTSGFVVDLSRTLLEPPQQVEAVWESKTFPWHGHFMVCSMCDFHDLHLRLSRKLSQRGSLAFIFGWVN